MRSDEWKKSSITITTQKWESEHEVQKLCYIESLGVVYLCEFCLSQAFDILQLDCDFFFLSTQTLVSVIYSSVMQRQCSNWLNPPPHSLNSLIYEHWKLPINL